MMKFLTIIFLTFYITKLFTGFKDIKKLMIKTNKIVNSDEKVDYSKLNDENLWTIVKFVIPSIGILVLQIVVFFYIFFATSHGNTYITIGFVIFWLLLLAKGLLKNKKKGLTDEECDKILKFSFKEKLIDIIDIAYFGYMFFVLFIK